MIKKELTIDQKREIKETFEIFDIDKEDKMDIKDLKTAMMGLGLRPAQDEIERIIKQVMNANNYTIAPTFLKYQEFHDVIALRISNKQSINDYRNVYKIMGGSDRQINVESLKKISERFNETLSEKELNELIEMADYDLDGEICESDFLNVLKRTNFY